MMTLQGHARSGSSSNLDAHSHADGWDADGDYDDGEDVWSTPPSTNTVTARIAPASWSVDHTSQTDDVGDDDDASGWDSDFGFSVSAVSKLDKRPSQPSVKKDAW
jgi:hypothetical protein